MKLVQKFESLDILRTLTISTKVVYMHDDHVDVSSHLARIISDEGSDAKPHQIVSYLVSSLEDVEVISVDVNIRTGEADSSVIDVAASYNKMLEEEPWEGLGDL